MTDTTETLNDLLRPQRWLGSAILYSIPEYRLKKIETALTAPLVAEIARLTARVELADRFATEYGDVSEASSKRPGGLNKVVAAWIAYYNTMYSDDATATAAPDAGSVPPKCFACNGTGQQPSLHAGYTENCPRCEGSGIAPTPDATRDHEGETVPRVDLPGVASLLRRQQQESEKRLEDEYNLSSPKLKDAPRDHGDDEIAEDRIHQACVAAAERMPKTTLHMVSKDVLDTLTTRLDEQATAVGALRTHVDETFRNASANVGVIEDWYIELRDRIESLEAPRDHEDDGMTMGIWKTPTPAEMHLEILGLKGDAERIMQYAMALQERDDTLTTRLDEQATVIADLKSRLDFLHSDTDKRLLDLEAPRTTVVPTYEMVSAGLRQWIAMGSLHDHERMLYAIDAALKAGEGHGLKRAPVVTDAMVEAYCRAAWPGASKRYYTAVSRSALRGLEAALAAGEGK